MLATRDKYGIDGDGKIRRVKLGMRPEMAIDVSLIQTWTSSGRKRTHDGRTDQDSSNDLGNDFRLSDLAQEETQDARNGNDNERLYDEKNEGA